MLRVLTGLIVLIALTAGAWAQQQVQGPPPSNEELLQGQVNILQQQNDWLNKIIARLKADEETRAATWLEWLQAAQAESKKEPPHASK